MSEQNQTIQQKNPLVIQRTASVELPKDPNVVTTAVKNVYIALNKANKAGVFDMNESFQIMNDFNLLTNIVGQLLVPLPQSTTATQAVSSPTQTPVSTN